MKTRITYFVICFIYLSTFKTFCQENNYSHAFDTYFAEAYKKYPSIPKGTLEAIAYANTRMRHVNPKKQIASCSGLPTYHGVMGLVEDGKGYFQNSLQLVAKLSGIQAIHIKQSPKANIFAFAKAFAKLQAQLPSLYQNKPEKNLTTVKALSELPTKSNATPNELAMNSHCYTVLSLLNDPAFQKAYNIPNRQLNLMRVFGRKLYKQLSADKMTVSRFAKPKEYNHANCEMPDGLPQYPEAIWKPVHPSNHGGDITPSTIAIHTIQGSYASAIAWFQNPAANVSAHYIVRSSDGQVTQLLCQRRKAWHVRTENDVAIGIEHEGFVESGDAWYTEAMYNSSAKLARFICDTENINSLQTHDKDGTNQVFELRHQCHKIKGHQHFKNNNHSDPGKHWDWPKYYRLINELPTPTTYTTATGTMYDDGGATGNYGNEKRTTYLIQPPNAGEITINFEQWAIEDGWDYVWIYDGKDDEGELIGKYSGTSPGTIKANSGAVFIEFRSDCGDNKAGWKASWTSEGSLSTNVVNTLPKIPILIYPNPATEYLYIKHQTKESFLTQLRVMDLSGKWALLEKQSSSHDLIRLDVRGIPVGQYILQIDTKGQPKQQVKFLINR